MARGDVHRLQDGSLVLDCQSDYINGFGTRLTIPLVEPGSINRPLPRLMPLFSVERREVVLATPYAAAVPIRALGERIASLAQHDLAITAALDMLLAGY